MKIIAHRGNMFGPDPKKETRLSYIDAALDNGFDVEIDVWYDGGLWLGHDKPTTKLTNRWMNDRGGSLWIHCKNLAALRHFSQLTFGYLNYEFEPNFFWHENDKFTMTSDGHIWTYPRQPLIDISICVLPELCAWTPKELCKSAGICTDLAQDYKIQLLKYALKNKLLIEIINKELYENCVPDRDQL